MHTTSQESCAVILLFLCFSSHLSLITSRRTVDNLVRKWAPLIWLAPGEKFQPSSVDFFFENTVFSSSPGSNQATIEFNRTSRFENSVRIISRRRLREELNNETTFLYGWHSKHDAAPLYALVFPCENLPENTPNADLYFTVEYWAFYPYNLGKEICFVDNVPRTIRPSLCLGQLITLGNHVGDWEHVKLTFKGSTHPSQIFLSIHNSGAIYKYNNSTGHFDLKVNPFRTLLTEIPPYIKVHKTHPILFAANGSHGFWSSAGQHQYMKYIIDGTGYGSEWKTWHNLNIIDMGQDDLPPWIQFKGRWGNPKADCLLWSRLGLCGYFDAPYGPLRRRRRRSRLCLP